MTITVVTSALELGFIYSLVALALFLSFRILNIADMTTDGSFTLGCAVSATVAVASYPWLALPAAMIAGAAAGSVTALLQTKCRVPSILAGIITNTGLYTVNLAVMGFSLLIVTMVYSVWWPQVVLFSQRPVIQLKNCVLFILQNFWRTLGAAALQLGWWILMGLFMPWTAFLVPFLGVWYILFVSQFFLYDRLDAAFRIEEQIAESFPEQIPVYDGE